MSAKNYTFEHQGKKITLPAFSEIPFGAFRKARDASNEMDRAGIIFENVLDAKSLAVIDSMTLVELGEVLAGWTAGASLGESSES